MYLGSVRFFKHLILSVIFLTIIALAVATVFLAMGNNEKSGEIEKLSADKDALQTLFSFGGSQNSENSDNSDSSQMSASQIYEILEVLEVLGIDNKDLVNTIYQNDRQAFTDVLDSSGYVESGNFDNVSGNSGNSENLDSSAGLAQADERGFEPNVTGETGEGEDGDDRPDTGDTGENNDGAVSDASPYAGLYPGLYAEPRSVTEYIDDTDYIYLTFDDGPAKHTDNILMYLDKHNVKATFFVMPVDTDAGKAYLNRMLSNGHEIGIHTMSHDYEKIYSSVEAYLDDFNQAYSLVYAQTGYKPYLYRFPGGSLNDYNRDVRDEIIEEMTRRGFIYFDWNVDSRDAFDADWTTMYNSVLEDVSQLDRAIVLFHDRPGGYNTVTVIEDIIKALLADPRGYTFSIITPQTKPEQF